MTPKPQNDQIIQIPEPQETEELKLYQDPRPVTPISRPEPLKEINLFTKPPKSPIGSKTPKPQTTDLVCDTCINKDLMSQKEAQRRLSRQHHEKEPDLFDLQFQRAQNQKLSWHQKQQQNHKSFQTYEDERELDKQRLSHYGDSFVNRFSGDPIR